MCYDIVNYFNYLRYFKIILESKTDNHVTMTGLHSL